MFTRYSGGAPTNMYSDIEGGVGWWRDTRFATGHRWNDRFVGRKDSANGPLVTLPEYYRLGTNATGKPAWNPVLPEGGSGRNRAGPSPVQSAQVAARPEGRQLVELPEADHVFTDPHAGQMAEVVVSWMRSVELI